jgi:3-oxoacyl-[acyl-carrier protein] reductase
LNHVIDVHLNGTFNCCRQASPLMAKQRSGRIINVGSHAFLGTHGGTGYAAAKGGIISLTRAMARDLLEYKVTCNAFCPGAKTRLSSGEQFEQHVNSLSARGLVTEAQKKFVLNPSEPDLVPPLVLYLATDEAANVTGQVFTVWGGYIGLFPEPKEVSLVYKKQHLWTLDELITLMPSKLSGYLWNSAGSGDKKTT